MSRIEKEADETLRVVTADGRTIPRCGYRLEDFLDDEIGSGDIGAVGASRDALGITMVPRCSESAGVRESAAVYRLRRNASG